MFFACEKVGERKYEGTSELPLDCLFVFYSYLPSLGRSVVSDAGILSRSCEFEPKLGQHSYRRLKKVYLTNVIQPQPM